MLKCLKGYKLHKISTKRNKYQNIQKIATKWNFPYYFVSIIHNLKICYHKHSVGATTMTEN